MKTSKVVVNLDMYKNAHGKTPKGNGLWFFYVGGEQFQFSGDFAEAKKAAVAFARSHGEPSMTVGS